MNWIFITLGIAAVVIIIGLFVILKITRTPVEKFQATGITKRKFTSRGIAIGLVMGISLGLSIRTVSIWKSRYRHTIWCCYRYCYRIRI